MTTGGAILIALVGGVAAAILAEMRLKRGRTRPLAARFTRWKARPDLGMEATDLEQAQTALRRNSALAAKTGAGGGQRSWTEVGAASRAQIGDARDVSR